METIDQGTTPSVAEPSSEPENCRNPSGRSRVSESELRDRMNRSRVPVRHRMHALAYDEPKEWAAKRRATWDIISDGGIVALIGTRGTGKTQLAVDLVRWCCEVGRSASYLKVMDFFTGIRATFRSDAEETEAKVIDRHAEPWYLVIDNVDRRGSSDWEDRLLTHLIDKRYDRCMGTVLIANLDEKAFATHVGADIVDRIRDGGGLIVADWPGFRGASE